MELILIGVLIGNLQVTSYMPVPSQTDASPTWTSIGDRTTKFGCAVSRDLLSSGQVKYGEILFIEGFGYRVVNDSMGPKAKSAIDLLVFTKDEERKVDVKFRKVWVVRHNETREPRKTTEKKTGRSSTAKG